MVFHWSDGNFPQVSRTFPSILAVLDNAVVWMIFVRPPISKLSSTFTKPLGIVTSAPITIVITVTSMFRSFFQFSSKVEVLITLFPFFQFYPVVSRNGKVHNSEGSLLLLTITRSGRLAEIRWSVGISKSHCILYVSFSWTDSWVVYISFVRMVIFILLLFTLWKFFTSELADCLSLEFQWQQVSTSLQDSSQYSSRSQ